MEIEKFLIKNEFISSDEVVKIVNPFSKEVVKQVYKTNNEQIGSSLNYLAETFLKYRSTPTYQRSALLEKISNKISKRKEDLAYLITLETGKPIKFSRIEIERAALTFKLGSEEAKRIGGEVLDLDLLKGSENKFGIVKRFPLGIIFAITPWNFPINLAAHKISPALASGNTIILKPASSSLCCGIELGKIIKECSEEVGLDYCPINVITSSGSETEKFLTDDRIKLISFTGSPVVGWGIKKKITHQKTSLELGGNAGVIVDESADLDLAASKIALGAFAQAGQSCISVQRVFVHEKVYNKFQELLLNETKKLKVGDPFKEDTIVGSMIDENEAKRIESWIKEAVDSGGKILIGGKRESALLEPTIMTNVDKNQYVNCKEVFAPFMTLKPFIDFKEAVVEVDDSDYGLQAGVFTNDINNALF
ncbi:MAG: aldehyde dehydrogenase family protein, partial [Bacteroidetes bacterium]|nr:aldehyde dehydrogenase family protein [Bacteroidota bacterium]